MIGTIGGTTPLAFLSTGGLGTAVLANPNGNDSVGTIFVTGAVVFTGPVILAEHANIRANADEINFINTVDSENSEKDLIISNALNSTITMVSDIGTTNRLRNIKILNSSNTVSILRFTQILTTGNQIWESDIEMNNFTDNILLNSSNNGTIQLGVLAAGNTLRNEVAGTKSLTVETNGEVIVNSIIGDNNQQLLDFSINSASSIQLNSSSITADNSITFAAAVTLNTGSVLNADVVGFQSDVENSGFDLTFNTTDTNDLTNIAGVLSGTGDFIKEGLGDMAFDSINTFSGDLLLNQGVINNTNNSNAAFANVGTFSLAQGTEANIGGFGSLVFDLANNQTMIGKGTCNCFIDVKNGAIVSPGFSPGQLSVTQLDMDTGSTLSIELEGTIAGTEYDQVKSLANINIDADTAGGANLELSVTNGFVPAVDDTFTIIEVNTSTLGDGTFNGLAEGDLISANGYYFSISYIGGVESNDVVLTVVDSIIYVDADAGPGGDGQSWATAFYNLQDALAVAVSGMEIWVAEGVYYPDDSTDPNPQDQTSTFTLIEGVDVYGGFAGIETELIQRDPTTNTTILSGDIDGDDIDADANNIAETVADIQGSNVYHVINAQNVNQNTFIDGFTVTAGHASGLNDADSGGAIICDHSDDTLSINQMVFIANFADDFGGALYHCNGEISNSQFYSNFSNEGGAINATGINLTNVIFMGNSSTNSGGALYTSSFAFLGDPAENYLDNVLFSGNSSNNGGAILVGGDVFINLNNVTFSGNHADSVGGAIRSTSENAMTVVNSIIWNNQDSSGQGTASSAINSDLTINNSYSLIQGFGTTGTANLDEDPLFVTDTDPITAPTSDGNAHLMYISNAIDAGDDTAVTTMLDLDGEDRIQGSAVDMGAYEYTDLIFANGFE